VESGGILIAHKDALARGYLRLIAEGDLELTDCGEVEDFDTLVERLREDDSIKLAVVDLDLPGMSHEVGLRYLALRHPALRIAVLFGRLTREKLEELATSRIAALVPKQTSHGQLVEILHKVISASGFVSLSHFELSENDEAETQLLFLHHELTGRQLEVLRLLSLGHSNREIGRTLGIAEGTVKVHVNAAFKVLGVHNRVSATIILRSLFQGSSLANQG
jgi:DNA-binding NarL/FixJ family response regulator